MKKPNLNTIIANNLNKTTHVPNKGMSGLPNKKATVPFVSNEGYKNGLPPVGSYYRIPSDTLYNPTPYRIKATPNNGPSKWLEAYDTSNTQFPGADYVDEQHYDIGGALPKAQNGFGCTGKSKCITGSDQKKKDGISGGYIGGTDNIVAPSNAPINYDELTKYVDDQYTDRSSKKQRQAEYAQAAQLYPGLTKNDFYASQAEASRLNSRINDIPTWDKPENQTYDRAWYPYYRSIIQPGVKVNSSQILKFISGQPGGIGGYRQTVESNYGLKKNKYGGWLNQYADEATQFGQYAEGGSSWMLTNPNRIATYFPRMANGGGLLSRTVTCSNCGWSWKAVDGGADPTTCHKCGGTIKMKNGGDISIPDLQEDNWLKAYGPGGQTTDGCPPNFYKNAKGQCVPEYNPNFKIPHVASESTSRVFFNPLTGERVNTATTGQTKENLEASTRAMGKSRRRDIEEEKQRVAERKAAVATKDKGKPFTFPTGETKKFEDMTTREQFYVSGKALENRGRFFDNEESILDDFNPLNWLGSIAGALGTAPYQAKQTNSYMPYVGAVANPLIQGALGFDPLGGAMKVPSKIAQSMKSGLLSKASKINPFAGTFKGESKLPSFLQLNKLDDPSAYWRLTKDAENYGLGKGSYFNKGVPLTGDVAKTFPKGSRAWGHRYSGPKWNPKTGKMDLYDGPDYLFKVGDEKFMEPHLNFPEPHLKFFRQSGDIPEGQSQLFKKDWLQGWKKEVAKPTSTQTITRGPINYWEEPNFAARNPKFNPNSYANSVNKFGNTSGNIQPEMMPRSGLVSGGLRQKKQGGDISIPNLQGGGSNNISKPISIDIEPKPTEGTNKQKDWLISYIKSPMYRERLKKEFPNQNNVFITNEVNQRLNNVLNEKVEYVKSIGKKPEYISGITIPKQYEGEWYDYKEDKFLPGKWGPDSYGRGNDKPGHIYLENEYRPNAWNPTKGFETTPLHEFGHAADDGGVRIPTSTKNKIFNYTKSSPNEPYYRSQGMTFNYYNTPTEFINRIQPIRYLLENNKIYNAGTQVFGNKEYDKMMQNSTIKSNVYFQDIMNSLKGTAEQKKAAFIDIMNSVAQNDQPQNEDMQYAEDGVIVTKTTTRKILESSSELKDFMKDWNNSPMATQMLQNSVDKDDPAGINSIYARKIRDQRNNLISTANMHVMGEEELLKKYKDLYDKESSSLGGFARHIETDYNKIRDFPKLFVNPGVFARFFANNAKHDVYTRAAIRSPKNYKFEVNSKDFNGNKEATDQVMIHELSHAGDYGGFFMPNSDKRKIAEYAYYAPKFSPPEAEVKPAPFNMLKNTMGKNVASSTYVAKPQFDENRKFLQKFDAYVAEPTETRARLMNLRYNAKNQKLYNPFTEKATKKVLDQYDKGNPKFQEYDPLLQLRYIYTDDQIIDLLNTISKDETIPFQNTDTGKYGGIFENGGSLNQYDIGGLTCPPGFFPKPPYNGCFNAQGQTLEQVQAEVGKKGIYHAITNPNGVRPSLSLNLFPSVTKQTTQSPLTKNTILNEPLANSNSYIQQQQLQRFNNTKRVEDNKLKNKILNQPQLKQAKRETPYERERNIALNSSYVGSNQYAALDDKGDIVPKYSDTDLSGKIIDRDANRQRRILGTVGGLASPFIAAGAVLGAGEIAAGVSPFLQATGAAFNAPIAGVAGLTPSNLLTAYTGYKGIEHLPHLAHSYEEVYNNPTNWKNWGDAAAQTLNTGLHLYPLTSEIKAGINTYRGVNHIAHESLGKVVLDKTAEEGLKQTSNFLKPIETPVLNTSPVFASPGPKGKKSSPETSRTTIPAHKYGGSFKTGGWVDKYAIGGLTTETTTLPPIYVQRAVASSTRTNLASKADAIKSHMAYETSLANKRDKKVNSDAAEAKDWMMQYYNSPMFKELYSNSVANDKKMGKVPRSLHTDLSDIQFGRFNVHMRANGQPSPETAGVSYFKNGVPYIDRKNSLLFSPLNDITVHEISHQFDYNGQAIPQTDIDLIKKNQKIVPEKYYKQLSFWDKLRSDPEEYNKWVLDDLRFQRYVGDPTETIARLRTAKYLGKTEGIYDPFTQKVNMDQYKKIKKVMGSNGYNPIDQLEMIYTPEQIIDMMNKIAQNKTKNSDVAKSDVAKYGGTSGGWLDKHI
jgi:hypothetical protein